MSEWERIQMLRRELAEKDAELARLTAENERLRREADDAERTLDAIQGVLWPLVKHTGVAVNEVFADEARDVVTTVERLRAACREAVACISALVLGRVMGQPFAPGAEAEINRVTDLLNAALAGEDGRG